MSRCFLYPPPGYEKKTRPEEDANLLIKENSKDKRQKKDKKHKERKERKEKDKERSSEKHREKKEKKHKQKDKKEKSRDKEEKETSKEKKIVGLSVHQNREEFGLTGLQIGQTQNSRLLLDLEKKAGNDNGAKGMQTVDRITVTVLKSPGKALEHNVAILDDGNQKFKDKREENRTPNGQTVKVNATGLANGFVHSFPPKNHKNIEGSFYQEDKVTEKQKERKDANKQKGTDGREDKQEDGDREKKSKSKDKKRKKEKEKAKELSIPVPSNFREKGNNAIDSKNDKDSYLFKESNVQNGILGKRKGHEMHAFLNVHDIQNNKLPRLVSSSRQVVQTGSIFEPSSPGNRFALEKQATVQKYKSNAKLSSSILHVENGRKLEMTQIAIHIASERQEAVNKYGEANDSLSSLKPTLESGRYLESCRAVRCFTDLEHGMMSNHTKNNEVLSLVPVPENKSILGSCKFNNLNAVERQGPTCNSKFSDKESPSNGFVVPKLDEGASRINGLVELKKRSACSMGFPSASLRHKENVEKHMKPPHPDVKYLSKILSVPKIEWSDFDEQEWLFGSKGHQGQKPKYVSPTIEKSKQVWAEALQMESADITALPYVIPY